MAAPILPRNASDPTGQDRRERAAIAEFSRKLRQVGKLYQDALKRIPYQVVTVNAKIYQFDLNPDLLASILGEISLAVDRILLEGGPDQLWFTQQYVVPAYQQGTAQQWANLGAQSETYQASRPALESLLTSDPYRRRIGYLRAREFELMRGFNAETKAHMSRILADGLATGQNPLQVARDLTKQLGIEERRAERIARTEIPTAFRQARLDEAEQAQTELGIQSREMHLSALSPTTRPTHRARHATLHTSTEQRAWWQRDANSIRCKCSSVTVLVDAKGAPLTPGIVERAKRMAQT